MQHGKLGFPCFHNTRNTPYKDRVVQISLTMTSIMTSHIYINIQNTANSAALTYETAALIPDQSINISSIYLYFIL